MVGKCGNETSAEKAGRPKISYYTLCIYACGGGETRNFVDLRKSMLANANTAKIVNDVRSAIVFRNFPTVTWRYRSARGMLCTIRSRSRASHPNRRNAIPLSSFIRNPCRLGKMVEGTRMDLGV